MKIKESKDAYEFVSIAAHQMRGPLGSIKGYASMILDGDFGEVPKELIEPLTLIFKSADSLSKTVNDFMDTSKMEQGQMRYYLKDFDLCDLLKQTIVEIENTIKIEIKLKAVLPKNPIIVHADKAKIKHIILNLIDNANKYTERGEIVVVLERRGSNRCMLSVKDSGMGMSDKIIPTLFQKFVRAPEANKINNAGTGLGLYVVQKMVEAHNGKVWAESSGEGKGSQFYVELPTV